MTNKEIKFRENLFIEIFDDDNIAIREYGEIPYNYDDSFIMFKKDEMKKFIEFISKIIKENYK